MIQPQPVNEPQGGDLTEEQPKPKSIWELIIEQGDWNLTVI